MNKEQILHELRAFPKEYKQSEEQKKDNLYKIITQYEVEKRKSKNWFTGHKLMVGSAGVFAVVLACFLIFTNIGILNIQGDQNSAKQQKEAYISEDEVLKIANATYPKVNWEKPKFTKIKERPTWIVSGTLPDGYEVVMYIDAVTGEFYDGEISGQSPFNGFYTDKLDNIKKIVIQGGTGEPIEITAKSDIQKVTSILKSAEFYAENDQKIEDANHGWAYSIYLGLEDDSKIPIILWSGEERPNLIDLETRNLWSVEGLEKIVESYWPVKKVDAKQAIQIAKDRYPDWEWEYNENSVRLVTDDSFTVAGDKVWYVTGITNIEKKITIFIDPNTGKIIGEGAPLSTEDGKNTAVAFFEKIQNGDIDGAWNMIHSRAKSPSLKAGEDSFKEYFGSNKPELIEIESATWEREWFKYPECMCYVDEQIKIKASFTGGLMQEFHVMREDEADEWKLWWSYEKNKLK